VTDEGATTTNTITLNPSGNNKGLIANGSGSGHAIDIDHAGGGTKLNIETTGAGDLINAGTFSVDNAGNVAGNNLSGTNTGDDAVNSNYSSLVSNATHSGEVTGATALTIADNVVDEANLKLDVTPTDDYVLTADAAASGGMKWAAGGSGTPEGTAILSTGETVGKVLQADGDNSSSWVTPTGGVDTSGTPVTNDFARFTDADTIEGRSYAEVKSDLNLEIGTDVLAQQTIGIADNNLVETDSASIADNEIARFTANGLESRSDAEMKTQ